MYHSWKQAVLAQVMALCQYLGRRTFTLQELYQFAATPLRLQFQENTHPEAKIRQQLQRLRDEKLLRFNDRGCYTLEAKFLLQEEVEEEVQPLLEAWMQTLPPLHTLEHPEVSSDASVMSEEAQTHHKKEYLFETYVRDKGWVKLAKQTFGYQCFMPECRNTFIKPDGTPYIEVHHIIPLHQGGEDGLWNLSTLCAHHHRMAHFADPAKRQEITEFLRRRASQYTV
ncbi:MAG: HNH endonuclease [Vampirovibrionales bacterium]